MQPLPSGLVLPDRAVLLSSFLYITVLSAACMMVSLDLAVACDGVVVRLWPGCAISSCCAGVHGFAHHCGGLSGCNAAVYAAAEALMCREERLCCGCDCRVTSCRRDCSWSGALQAKSLLLAPPLPLAVWLEQPVHVQHGVALENMVALSSFTFLGIMHREILMDMNDEAGDRAAGVLTLPVVFGASIGRQCNTHKFWSAFCACW